MGGVVPSVVEKPRQAGDVSGGIEEPAEELLSQLDPGRGGEVVEGKERGSEVEERHEGKEKSEESDQDGVKEGRLQFSCVAQERLQDSSCRCRHLYQVCCFKGEVALTLLFPFDVCVFVRFEQQRGREAVNKSSCASVLRRSTQEYFPEEVLRYIAIKSSC